MKLTLRNLGAAAALLAAAGCQWLAPRSQAPPPAASDAPAADDAVRRLEARARSLELDLARANAQIERRDARIALLENELASVRADLETAERQFVTIERGLLRDETRASAVTAIAEARLRRDRVVAADSSAIDSAAAGRIETLLRTATNLVDRGNYPAAVYYARRAAREIERARRHAGEELAGDVAVVAAERVNLRAGPSATSRRVARLAFGDVVVRIDRRGDWVRVRTRHDREGWIRADLLH